LYFQIDLCVNNTYGVGNTRLLARYLAVDDRARPLAMAVKYWAKHRGVNNSRNSTLSSYSWVLLVIHYLQVTAPPVLQVLRSDDNLLEEEGICGGGWNEATQGPQCLANLLHGFFYYYCMPSSAGSSIFVPSSNWHDWVGSSIWFEDCLCRPKFDCGIVATDFNSWRLCMMDPVEPGRDLSSVITREEGQQFIIGEMRRAVTILNDFFASSDCCRDGEEVKGNDGDETVRMSTTASLCWDNLCSVNADIPHLPMLCLECNSDSHLVFECPNRQCKNCGLKGHLTANCTRIICYRCRGSHKKGSCPVDAEAKQVDAMSEDAFSSLVELPRYMQTARCNGTQLMKTALCWTVADFCDTKLIAERLIEIPAFFGSSSQWFGSFDQFVAEELRSDLQGVVESDLNELDNISEVQLVSSKIDYDQGTSDGVLHFVTKSDYDLKKLKGVECTLCLMVQNCPDKKTLEVVKSLPNFLVEIGYPPNDKKDKMKKRDVIPDSFNTRLRLSKASEAFAESRGRGWTAIFLRVGITSAVRLCDALAAQRAPPFMTDILRARAICCTDVTAESSPLRTATLTPAACEVIENILQDLNDSQRQAIESVLDVGSPGTEHIQIIKGPPGN
jgi:hypothetical protein